jgi:hypothetical protein
MSDVVTASQKRIRSIDIFKGLLVLGMVYCHTLQFYSSSQVYPNAQHIIEFVNLITFSGFVFSFGYVCQLAYYSKPFRQSGPRMLLTAIKTLFAFYVSGTAYRIFIDGRLLSWDNIRPLFLLEDIPGWSEFLASFTYLIFVGLLLFVPLKWLVARRWIGFITAGVLLLTTFFPYGSVHVTQLGPLIGMREFATFPVVQYFPYYLLGMLFARYRIVWDWRVLTGAVAASGTFLWKWISTESLNLPERFPPSLWWIIGPAVVLYGYMLLSCWMERYPSPFAPLEAMGRNVLWFLVMSNVLIFALKHTQDTLMVSALDGFWMACVILSIVGFSVWIITKPTRPRTVEAVRADHGAA